MSEEPLVSIGIPTYNRPAGLRQILNCITTQTYQNLEIIISDNASPDLKVENVACEFTSRDSRIQYYKQKENKGAEFNFKFVLQQAHGEYFLWAADDDLWEPDILSSMVGCTIENPDLVFVGGNYGSINYITGEKIAGLSPELKVENSLYKNCLNLINLPTSSLIYFLFRRDILIKTKFIRQQAFDFADLFVLYEVALKGKMLTLPKLLYWAGITEEVRVDKSFGKKLKWLRFNYSQYYIKSLGLFFKTDRLSAAQKLCLIQALNRQMAILVRHHETKNLGSTIMFVLTSTVKLINWALSFALGILDILRIS